MDWLAGKQVVFTGKLASMTRKEAARVVGRHGGQATGTVSRQTNFVIVGQEGWPLQRDGKLTSKLQKAGKLQGSGLPVEILSEDEFLDRLGLAEEVEGIHRLYAINHLARLLRVPGDRLKAWVREGLIHSQQTVDGIDYFDFRQVLGAKTLCETLQAGASLERVRRSLRQLTAWLKVDQPLAQLALLEKGGQLLVRLQEGLADTSGQMLLDFDEDHSETLVAVRPVSAEEWFERGCELEDEGSLLEAIVAYRQALLVGGPDNDVSFNLANVLFATGQKEAACERFRVVIESDAGCAEAWNNLGIALVEIEHRNEAEQAFRKAIELCFLDAHYNLADLLENTGRHAEAREHWRSFVRQTADDRWRRHAERRLTS